MSSTIKASLFTLLYWILNICGESIRERQPGESAEAKGEIISGTLDQVYTGQTSMMIVRPLATMKKKSTS